MFSFLAEIHFCSYKDDIEIKNTDFSAIRYQEKKNRSESIYDEGKKIYCQKRGISLQSTKKNIKIKEFEEQLAHNKIVYCKWRDNCIFEVILSSGMIIHVRVNVLTGIITNISFDNYLVDKLDSENILDVIFLKSHIIFSYAENLITTVFLSKSLAKHVYLEKLSRLDAQIQTHELAGTLGRCKISSNLNGDMLAVWRKYNGDEVHPWSPSTKEQERANIYIYGLSRSKLELLCFYRTEFDPLCVEFSTSRTNVLHSVEQKISSKGVVTVEKCTYEINKYKFIRTTVTSIPLQTQVCCHTFNPNDEKLVLGCIDGSLVLFDGGKSTTLIIKIAFIPSFVSFNDDETIILVSNERSQFQFFDISLCCVPVQLIGEDTTSSSILDLSTYFRSRHTLSHIHWSKKPEQQLYSEKFTQFDSMVLLMYDKGPMAFIKLICSTGPKGNSYDMGYTPDVLIHQYLLANKVEKAINILLALDWNYWGSICLLSLNRIFNYLIRKPFTPDIEVFLQTALSSFHMPSQPMCQATREEFEDQVKSLSRRFFHLLIRYQLFEKAFCLAIDIGDHDLFMDMNYYAWFIKDYDLAVAAKNKALQLYESTKKFLYFNES